MLRTYYTQQLEALHAELQALGKVVMTQVAQALDTLEHQDLARAQRIVDQDVEVNRMREAVETHVIHIVATQQPVAHDLRQLMATVRIADELERIGDYAKHVAQVTLRNIPAPHPPADISLPVLVQHVVTILGNSLSALERYDATAAFCLQKADEQVDVLKERVHSELLRLIEHNQSATTWAVDRLMVVHDLERIADRTANIGEQVIFVVSAEVVTLNS